MKKRIFAAFLAVMMMLSMFVLAGCNTNVNESSDASSTELTNKSLFEASIQNLFSGVEEYKEFTQKSGTGELNLNVDKLVFGEMDLTQLGKISLTVETVTDGKNTNSKFSLSAFGETIPAEMAVQDGEAYFVDFFGLNDKTIKVEMPEADESEGATAGVSDAISKAPAIVEHVMKSIETVLGANIVEDDFSAEEKDVTVLGSEFKGAKVITLTVNDEKVAKIATELVDKLRENEDVKDLFSDDFNKAEFAEDIKDIKGLRVVNTVVDEKSVALKVYIDAMEEKESDVENVEEANAESSDAEVEKEQKTFAIDIACVDKNFSLEMGYINDANEFVKDDGILSLTIKDDGSKFDVSFKITEENEVNEMLTVKADITNGKYDGTVTLNGNDSVIEINYTAKGDKSEGEFGIDGIKITKTDYEGEETTQDIPLTLTASYKNEESKMTAEGTLKLTIEEAAEIEASFDMVSEYKDVTVEAVTDSIPMNEFDMETAMGEFATKYPTINSFADMLGGSQGNEDETYFEKDGLGLWLPSDFNEMQADGFTAAYTNGELMVLTSKDSYDNYVAYDEFTFDDYVNAVYVNYAMANPTDIAYDDYGNACFEYCAEGYGYYVTILEGYDAYWLVLCACEETELDDNRETFAEWMLYSDPYADVEFDEDI